MKYHSFCAANSGDGFLSFFETILNEQQKRVYYIKGGPGSGKSTLMRQIADRAKDAELIHCSGDPESLDGVILPNENAVIIDATSPHSHEPKYPGVGGNLIDLGIIWNPDLMNKDRIITLCNKKSMQYQSCYHLLKSIKALHSAVFEPIKTLCSTRKIQMIGDKILRQNALWEDQGVIAEIDHRFLSAITPIGLTTYSETFSTLGKNVILIEDRWMISDLLLHYLDTQLTARGIDHINAYHPLLGKNALQHIIIPSASLSIVSKDGIFPIEIDEAQIMRKISLQTTLEKEKIEKNRNKLIFIKRLLRELLKLTVERLNEIRTTHLEIEQEYAAGADFEASKAIKERLINNLFV